MVAFMKTWPTKGGIEAVKGFPQFTYVGLPLSLPALLPHPSHDSRCDLNRSTAAPPQFL